MSDTMQGGVHPFPERTQVFRRDRRMTTADDMIRNADDWRIYVREDAVQAQISAAVAAERERCAVLIAKFDMPEAAAAIGFNFSRDAPSRVFAAAIRRGEQP
jgi:hypothetical protein